MRTLYYSVEADIGIVNKELYLGKKKTIRVYDIDTQYMSLIEIYGFSIPIDHDSETSISNRLKEDYGKEQEFNLIKL